MMLKALFIIPMTCFAIYAFATPEAEVQVQQVKKTAVKQQKKATLTPQKKVTPTPQKSATPTPQKKTATTSQQKVTTVVGEGIPSGEIKPDDHIYDIVEVNAQFPGGDEACMKWIAGHMKYPEEAVKNNIQGRVMVRFTVEKDGEITDVKAVRSPSPLLAEEAERVVKAMPKWKPAKNKGEIVRSTFNLPISFRLSSPQPSKE